MSSESRPKPRIGVPYRTRKEELIGDFGKLENYVRAITRAGGEAVVVSLGRSAAELKKLAQSLDGVLLSGSPADVDPGLFQAPRHSKTVPSDSDRDRTDFALLEHALAAQKPVLAICFGVQSLNVFLGGTLVQDIPSEVTAAIEHEWDNNQGAPETFHPLRIEPNSYLAKMAGSSEARVNSSHHQSILEPGGNLRIVAHAPDQVVEAVEWAGENNFVMGVQWHPERMTEDMLANRLFLALVEAARKTPVRA
jgi:putative glutamine amidotransferase